jgi:hypothetical protein
MSSRVRVESSFVDGPGGTGKTYLYKALLAKVQSIDLIAITGIAASIFLMDAQPTLDLKYQSR